MDENSQLQKTVQENLASADKWKSLHDSLFVEWERCQERIGILERDNERISSSMNEQIFSKDQVCRPHTAINAATSGGGLVIKD